MNMDNTEILHKVEEVFRDVLDDEEITLTATTTANDIEDWDSLSHVELVRAVEKAFGTHPDRPRTAVQDFACRPAGNPCGPGHVAQSDLSSFCRHDLILSLIERNITLPGII